LITLDAHKLNESHLSFFSEKYFLLLLADDQCIEKTSQKSDLRSQCCFLDFKNQSLAKSQW